MKINKKTMRIICAVIIALTVIVSIGNICFAEISAGSINGKQSGMGGENQIQNVGNYIATIIRNIGIVLAVILLMILGIKYMVGSAEEKADYKKTMIPYLVGVVVLFGASAIAQVVISMGSSITAGN